MTRAADTTIQELIFMTFSQRLGGSVVSQAYNGSNEPRAQGQPLQLITERAGSIWMLGSSQPLQARPLCRIGSGSTIRGREHNASTSMLATGPLGGECRRPTSRKPSPPPSPGSGIRWRHPQGNSSNGCRTGRSGTSGSDPKMVEAAGVEPEITRFSIWLMARDFWH